MTTIGSCDHHDEAGLVPSNRGRARVVEQLTAAVALGDTFAEQLVTARFGMIDQVVCVYMPLTAWSTLFKAWAVWIDQCPRGDDLAPAPPKPPEIVVPTTGETGQEESP